MSTIVQQVYLVEDMNENYPRKIFNSLNHALVYAAEVYNDYNIEDFEQRYKDLRQLIEYHYIEDIVYVIKCDYECEDLMI